jgi:hypothetical protein
LDAQNKTKGCWTASKTNTSFVNTYNKRVDHNKYVGLTATGALGRSMIHKTRAWGRDYTLCNKLVKDPIVQFGGGASFGLGAGAHDRFPLNTYIISVGETTTNKWVSQPHGHGEEPPRQHQGVC